MSGGTHLSNFLFTLNDKWKEVELLLDKADLYKSEENFFSALCRSSCILLVSHLEGMLKELAKGVVSDLNAHWKFNELPKTVQMTFCRNFTSEISESGSDNKRIHRLIEKFSETNVRIDDKPFFHHKKSNHNPTGFLFRCVLENFGASNCFCHIHSSKAEIVFMNDPRGTENLLDQIVSSVSKGADKFPYDFELSEFDLIKDKAAKGRVTLYETFLEGLNQRRHGIVHGNEFGNLATVEELKRDFQKSKIFSYTIIGILMYQFSRQKIDKIMTEA